MENNKREELSDRCEGESTTMPQAEPYTVKLNTDDSGFVVYVQNNEGYGHDAGLR